MSSVLRFSTYLLYTAVVDVLPIEDGVCVCVYIYVCVVAIAIRVVVGRLVSLVVKRL